MSPRHQKRFRLLSLPQKYRHNKNLLLFRFFETEPTLWWSLLAEPMAWRRQKQSLDSPWWKLPLQFFKANILAPAVAGRGKSYKKYRNAKFCLLLSKGRNKMHACMQLNLPSLVSSMNDLCIGICCMWSFSSTLVSRTDPATFILKWLCPPHNATDLQEQNITTKHHLKANVILWCFKKKAAFVKPVFMRVTPNLRGLLTMAIFEDIKWLTQILSIDCQTRGILGLPVCDLPSVTI